MICWIYETLVDFAFEELYDLKKHNAEEMLHWKGNKRDEMCVKTVQKIVETWELITFLAITIFWKIMP